MYKIIKISRGSGQETVLRSGIYTLGAAQSLRKLEAKKLPDSFEVVIRKDEPRKDESGTDYRVYDQVGRYMGTYPEEEAKSLLKDNDWTMVQKELA